jgi:hypothetical protein
MKDDANQNKEEDVDDFSDSISIYQEDIISKLEKLEINYIKILNIHLMFTSRKRKSDSLSSEKKRKNSKPKKVKKKGILNSN